MPKPIRPPDVFVVVDGGVLKYLTTADGSLLILAKPR
jgi:hypothetical protein